MLEPGTVLLSKYRIERVIGEGGMGVVLCAHHLDLDEPVAIKLLLPQALDDHEMVHRFLREAQAAAKLKSEHVARVLDVGRLESGAPYMVMELLEGTDLAGLLRRQGPLAPGQAVDLALQACEGLAEAHARGIVHRDIKPANFFITRRAGGSLLLKVLDFGISKAPAHLDDGITGTRAIMGTPAYMSPEQMRSSKHVDARADIWALGVVLYEALTGRRPFAGETFSALCLNVVMEPFAPMNVPLPAGLAEVVARCLDKEPDARFQDMAEVAAALAPFAQTPAQAATSTERTAGALGFASMPRLVTRDDIMDDSAMVTTGRPSTLGGSIGEVAALPRTASPRTRPRVALVAAALGMAGVIAALAVVFARGPGETSSAVDPVHPATPPAAVAAVAAAPQAAQPDAGTALVAERGPATSAEVVSRGRGQGRAGARPDASDRKARESDSSRPGDGEPGVDEITEGHLQSLYIEVGEAIQQLVHARGERVALPLRDAYLDIPFANALRTPSLRREAARTLRALRGRVRAALAQ